MPLQRSGNDLGLLKTGIGLTTTLSLNGFPKHPPELAPGMIGVRLYSATDGKSVRFLRLPVTLVAGMMVFSVPPINPTPRLGLLHRKTAPTLLGGLKVDHVLVSRDVTVRDYSVRPCRHSDHTIVIVDFRIESTPQPPASAVIRNAR